MKTISIFFQKATTQLTATLGKILLLQANTGIDHETARRILIATFLACGLNGLLRLKRTQIEKISVVKQGIRAEDEKYGIK